MTRFGAKTKEVGGWLRVWLIWLNLGTYFYNYYFVLGPGPKTWA